MKSSGREQSIVHSALANLMLALVYAGVYILCYVYFLNHWFDYAGYTLYAHDGVFLAWSVAVSVGPILCYRGMRGISSVLAVFVFVLLYIPIILTFSLGSDRPVPELLGLQLVFAGSMCMLFLADLILIRSPFDFRGRTDLMPWVLALTVAATAYVAFVYRGNLRFVSFGEAVYEQRAANNELGAGLATRYLSSWLNTVLIPLALAYGLVERRIRFFAVGSASCVIIYMATAAKATLLLPVIYAALFVLLGRGRLNRMYPLFVGALSLFLCVLLASTGTTDSLMFLISSILMMRTIGNGGQLTMAYYDFFATHPRTEYSHINLVRAAGASYPYGNLSIGEAVGHHFFGPETNANANFWATDGIAASGLAGVALITVVCALLFVVLNSVTRGYDRLFVVLCFLPFVLFFLNTSLFSSVWSGGAFFLIIFFLCNRPRARPTG